MKILVEIKEEAEVALKKICTEMSKSQYNKCGEIKTTPKVHAIREALIETAARMEISEVKVFHRCKE